MLPPIILALLGEIAGTKLPEDMAGDPVVDDENTIWVPFTISAIRASRQFLKSILCKVR